MCTSRVASTTPCSYSPPFSPLLSFPLSRSFCRRGSAAARTRHHVLKLKPRRKRDALPHFSLVLFLPSLLLRFPLRSRTTTTSKPKGKREKGVGKGGGGGRNGEGEGKARIRRRSRRRDGDDDDDTERKERNQQTKRSRSKEEETSNEGKMEESLKALSVGAMLRWR